MRFGLPVSFLLHAGLLAWAMFTLERTPPFKPPEPEPVEVAIISEDGLTRLRQGDRSAKNLEAAPKPPAPDTKALKEPPKPTPPPQAAAPPPPPPEPVKPEPPKPDPIAEKLAALPLEPQGPTPEELARIEAQKKAEAAKKAADEKKKRDELKRKQDEAKRLAELKRKQEEAKKKAAQQTDFDAEMQKALLDKAPPKPPTPGGAQLASASKAKGPVAGAPEGRDQVLTASQNALLGTLIKQAVSRCWNINAGAEGIDKIVVKLEVHLRPDGRLRETPRIVNSMPGPLFADTANSAVRAIVQCEPYSFPAELYKGGWDSLVWTFDPRKMF